MSELIGRQIEVGVAKEAVRGTAQTAPTKWLKHTNANIVSRNAIVVDDNVQNTIEDSAGARVVKSWADGALEGILHIDEIGFFFYNLYGTLVTTTIATVVKQHVFTLAQNIIHPTLTIFRKDGDVTQKSYAAGVVNTMEIKAKVGDFVRVAINMIFGISAANATTPTYGTEYDFISKDITVKYAATSGGLAGATPMSLKDLSIKWDTGANADFTLGSLSPKNFNAKMAIEVAFSKNMVDTVWEDFYAAGTYNYMQIDIIGTADIGTANYPTLTILLNKAQVQAWDRKGNANDLVTEDVKIKAFYNQTDTAQSTVTLKNLTATY